MEQELASSSGLSESEFSNIPENSVDESPDTVESPPTSEDSSATTGHHNFDFSTIRDGGLMLFESKRTQPLVATFH